MSPNNADLLDARIPAMVVAVVMVVGAWLVGGPFLAGLAVAAIRASRGVSRG